MARIQTHSGACPVCGESARRTVHLLHGMTHDVYHCTTHGRMAYGGETTIASMFQRASTSIKQLSTPAHHPLSGMVDAIA